MRDEHRLCPAQVRVGRHHRRPSLFRLVGTRAYETHDGALKQSNATTQIQPQIERDLFVS